MPLSKTHTVDKVEQAVSALQVFIVDGDLEPGLELIEARQSLESNIARFAALRANNEQIAAMEQTIEDLNIHRDDID